MRSHAKLATTPLTAKNARLPARSAPRDAGSARAFKRAVLERANHVCEIGPVLADASVKVGDHKDAARAEVQGRKCRGRARTAHHRKPRGMGGHGDNDPDNGIATCWGCHDFVESYRDIAYKLDLLEKH